MKHKVRKNKKKYGNGTGSNGTIANYLETPADALAENDINTAKAKFEGASNPWLLGMKAVGNMAMQYGIGQGGFNSENAGSDKLFGGMSDKTGNTLNNLLPLLGNMNFANGGEADGQIEAEGGEQVTLPNGDSFELEGPSHAGGGIDLDVAPGTKIFSKQISKDGSTMAEREQKRVRKVKRAKKKVDANPTDEPANNAYKRISQTTKKEEEEDLALQNLISFISGSQGEAMFGLSGDKGLPDILSLMMDSAAPKRVNKKKKKAVNGFDGTRTRTGRGTRFVSPEGDTTDPATLDNTFGDFLGIAGNIFSGVAPYLNTLKNRAEDTPNVNSFKDFGKEGLAKLEQSKNYIEGQKDEQLGDIQLSKAANIRRGRNSARSVSTSRALDLANSEVAGEQKANVYNNFSQQMMQLLGQEAQFENQQDQAVMTGEQLRDLNDRKDKDNFRTQLSANLADIGTGIQQTGKDLNQSKQQEAIFAILNQLSKYGITFNSDMQMQNPTN